MSSPYEDDVLRLIEARKGRLKELEEIIPREKGFFGRRKLEKETRMVTQDIAYLEEEIRRYRRGVGWNRKTFIDGLGTDSEKR